MFCMADRVKVFAFNQQNNLFSACYKVNKPTHLL